MIKGKGQTGPNQTDKGIMPPPLEIIGLYHKHGAAKSMLSASYVVLHSIITLLHAASGNIFVTWLPRPLSHYMRTTPLRRTCFTGAINIDAPHPFIYSVRW